MATVKMTSLWKDPRTGILMLRKRIPKHLKATSGRTGDTVKITTGTADRKAAERALPAVLARWEAMKAEWERLANVAVLTPTLAQEIASTWAAWITADPARLHVRPGDRDLGFGTVEGKLLARLLNDATAPEREAAILRECATDACRVAGLTVPEEAMGRLIEHLRPVVAAAIREDRLRRTGATGTGPRWTPLQHLRDTLPAPLVEGTPPDQGAGALLDDLFNAWEAVTVAKPRTVAETRYALDMFKAFVGHGDALRLTKDDVRRWRDTTKASGLTNNSWNNRLSLIRQVFAQAAADGTLSENPADNSLRLRKSKGKPRAPYSDADATLILQAARRETRPARRWAHWIMAFSGMRVAEVLQMTREDVRREGEVWYFAVHEDDEGKSVKSGQRRHVPLHPAVVAEGFLEYLVGVAPGEPLFPDKTLDRFGGRGGRGWNAVGRWVRETVGIMNEQYAPNHSWRHRIEDELRAAEVPEDARDAIVGHARATTGRLYGLRGEALGRLARELAKIKAPPGL